jgi:YjbE family integral membrane protein
MSPALAAMLQVILIDIVLAGDNAVVIGIVAAKVPQPDRRKVIFWGLVAAVVLRVVLATITATILEVIGLMFAGGVLLLWVSWRLYRDLRQSQEHDLGASTLSERVPPGGGPATHMPTSDLRRAILRLAVADLSMSLDNVLAVAGAAMNHVWVLTIGLLLSIALMGLAASMIANLLQRHPWISYAGLIIVVYVALRMIFFGGWEILHHTTRTSDNFQQQRSRVVAFLEARETRTVGVGGLDLAQLAAQ